MSEPGEATSATPTGDPSTEHPVAAADSNTADRGPADLGPIDHGPADPGPADNRSADDEPAEIEPVRAVVARLGELDELPLECHADVVQEIHATLQTALSDLNT